MALKDLSTQVMLDVTRVWLQDPIGRERLERDASLVGIIGRLEHTERSLQTTQSHHLGAAQTLREQTLEMGRLDQLHDRKVRGLYHTLTGLAELTDELAEAHRLLDLRNALFPLGMSVTMLGYQAQAEEAEHARERLEERQRAELGAIFIGDASLEAAVEAWLATARALGELHTAREALRQDHVGVERRDVLRARNQWIGTVRMLISAIDASESLSTPERQHLLEPLRLAEERAARRRSFSDA